MIKNGVDKFACRMAKFIVILILDLAAKINI